MTPAPQVMDDPGRRTCVERLQDIRFKAMQVHQYAEVALIRLKHGGTTSGLSSETIVAQYGELMSQYAALMRVQSDALVRDLEPHRDR